MQNQFHKLKEAEKNQLLEAPVLIAILIAGADGKIEENEIQWAEKVTHFRRETAHYTLHNFYETVGTDFEAKFRSTLASLPEDTTQRNELLASKLAELKPALAKMDEHYREKLVESFRSFAKQVAEASGGFLGFFSKSNEEAKWINLEMLG